VRACTLLRCSAACGASAGALGKLEGSTDERDRMLARVKELLALAGSPNEHEAANAMRMANKYLLKYNLDLAELEGRRNYARRWLGRCSGRIQEYEYTLGSILQQHFFVHVIWVWSYDARRDQDGRILEIDGTPENLEIAEYVYRYVTGLLEPLWRAHRRQNPGRRGTKLQYFAGLLHGLREKLDEQKTQLRVEQGLIWLGDKKLEEYHRHLHPRIRSIGGYGVTRNDLYDAGRRDGREITIRRGVEGNSAGRGRMLPGPG
jgi:hypothetical protein